MLVSRIQSGLKADSLKRSARWGLCAAVLAASGSAAWAVDLTVPAGATETLTDPNAASFGNLTIGGTLNVSSPVFVEVSALTRVNTGGTLNLAAGPMYGFVSYGYLINDGTITNTGLFTFDSSTPAAGQNLWTNNGTFTSIPSDSRVSATLLANQSNATTVYATFAMVNTGTMTLGGLFDRDGGISLAHTVAFNNSGTVTLLPGSRFDMFPGINSGPTEVYTNLTANGKSGTLVVQSTDNNGYVFGPFYNNAGSVIQLDPAAGTVQTFVGSGAGNTGIVGGRAQIIGAGEVQKTSPGTTVFNHSPFTYTGPTTVKGGMLVLDGLGDIRLSTTSVQTGGTLGGNGVAGPTSVQSGGTLKPGNTLTTAIGTLTVQGDLALDASSNAIFKLAAPDAPVPVAGVATPNGDVVAVTGGLTLNGIIKVTPQTGFAIGAYKVITYTGSLTKTAQLLKAATVDNSTVSPLGFVLSVDDATVPGEVWLVVKATPVIQPQTITYTSAPPAASKPGDTYNAAATATSGLSVVLTSTTPAICTISNGVVTFLANGICTLAADQAGNADFTPAPQVLQSMEVSEGRIGPNTGIGAVTPVPTLHSAALALLGLLAAAMGGAALRRRRNPG